MNFKKPAFSVFIVLSLCINVLATSFLPASTVVAAALPAIDDFETGLPAGHDANNIAIGFNTFQDSNPATSVAIFNNGRTSRSSSRRSQPQSCHEDGCECGFLRRVPS